MLGTEWKSQLCMKAHPGLGLIHFIATFKLRSAGFSYISPFNIRLDWKKVSSALAQAAGASCANDSAALCNCKMHETSSEP